MPNIELPEIIKLIGNNKRFTLLTHANPDPDTLCSACALYRALIKLGKEAEILNEKELSPRMKMLTEQFKTSCESSFSDSIVISVDVASSKLLGALEEKYSGKINLCIDHHENRDEFALFTFRNPRAAAAGEIIYKICSLLTDIDKGIADMLYCAISADTGSFKYSNTTAETHMIAAALIDAGANAATISNNLFERKSQNEIRALKLAYEKLEFYFGGKMSFIAIDNQTKNNYNLCDTDIEEFPSVARAIDGVELAIILKEVDNTKNKYKISMRSKSYIDVCKLCAIFGGGGHVRAAGATIFEDSLENAKAKLLESVKSELADTLGE